MKILLTGCAGFIGFHLAYKLLNNNHIVIGVDNVNNYYSQKLKKDRLKILLSHKKNKNFFFIKSSIENFTSLENIFKKNKPEVVINLAAQAGVRHSIKKPRDYINQILLALQYFDTVKRV